MFEIIFDQWIRPLIRNLLNCSCVGADKSFFAQLILRDVNNYKKDANLLAFLLVPPHKKWNHFQFKKSSNFNYKS